MFNTDHLILVGIIEDDLYFIDSLQRSLNSLPDIALAGVWINCKDACEDLRQLVPDVLLVNPEMARGAGVEYIRRIRQGHPDVKIMAVSSSDGDDEVFETLKAGAAGYILKSEGMDALSAGIRDLAVGWSPMSRCITSKMVSFFNRQEMMPEVKGTNLTKREQEILCLLAAGKMYKEISCRLEIALETTKKHMRNIYFKLQAQNRIEAVNKWRSLTQASLPEAYVPAMAS